MPNEEQTEGGATTETQGGQEPGGPTGTDSEGGVVPSGPTESPPDPNPPITKAPDSGSVERN